MSRIRKALLTLMEKVTHPVKPLTLWMLIFSLLVLNWPTTSYSAFLDLPGDSLYAPYIENFQTANIIVGDTEGGMPTGYLRPFDHIKRSEFTKITTLIRLLEEAQNLGFDSQYQGLNLNEFTLKINEKLTQYYKAQAGGIDFLDIEDKDPACASNPEGCHPWYAQYVNYAAAHGLVKGFPDGNFKPADSILRLHALKLILASNGELPATQDPRFQRLSNDARIKNVNRPKCLAGAEEYILKNNGGISLGSQNLFEYAILADKLDFFGAGCELFERAGANTAEKRAELLQKPLTRQEIARYFALTTSYKFLQIDHGSDETTFTEEENSMTYFEEAPSELGVDLENESMMAWEDWEKQVLNKVENEEEKIKMIEEREKLIELLELNKSKAEMSILELTTTTKEGRCCEKKEVNANCKKVEFDAYEISEESSYNYQTYEGGTWHEARRGKNQCWIPFEDILGGFQEEIEEALKERCTMESNQTHLVEMYSQVAYSRVVREIWTTGHSAKLKMFMQIGLDLAEKKATEFKVLIKNKEGKCEDFKHLLKRITAGHLAASLRHLPTEDKRMMEAEKMIK